MADGLPRLIRVSEPDRLDPGPRAQQRLAARGGLVRIRSGTYVDRAAWDTLEAHRRYLLEIAAVVASRKTRPVLFGVSAAVVLGLPVVGRRGGVHLLGGEGSAPPKRNGVVWHRDRVADDSIIEVCGFLVTDVERTLLDVARRATFVNAISTLDAGIRPVIQTPALRFIDGQLETAASRKLPGSRLEPLRDALSRMPRARGVASARRVVDFADPRAATPGESISRAQMHLLGFPVPDLQAPFTRADGGVDIVDFDWPQFMLSGEFDGKVKYFRDEYLADRNPSEVVWLERERERRLKRRHSRDMARWIWDDAFGRAGLRDELLAAGLPIVGPRR